MSETERTGKTITTPPKSNNPEKPLKKIKEGKTVTPPPKTIQKSTSSNGNQ